MGRGGREAAHWSVIVEIVEIVKMQKYILEKVNAKILLSSSLSGKSDSMSDKRSVNEIRVTAEVDS